MPLTYPASNALFDLAMKRKAEQIKAVLCVHDSGNEDTALAFARMARAVEARPEVMVVAEDALSSDLLRLPDSFVGVYFGQHLPNALQGIRQLSTVPLDVADPDFGFYQEMQAHDFELGGVIEWNEEIATQYSRFVLQSLSSVHVRRFFPWEAWNDLQAITPDAGRRTLRCLDIGCGPISKLRYGALRRWLHIVGVDPLNDIYSAIIARHGLDSIAHIRPDEVITGFAEDLSVTDGSFRFVYCCNALDHTQDLEASIRHLIDSMADESLAYVLVYTKEGQRQGYQGLHKFNIWCENGELLFNAEGTDPRPLSSIDSRLRIGRIYESNADVTAFSLIR